MDSEGNDKDGDHWVVDVGHSKSLVLNKAGRAKNYPMKSRWKQNLIGEFEVHKGTIRPLGLKWEDRL